MVAVLLQLRINIDMNFLPYFGVKKALPKRVEAF